MTAGADPRPVLLVAYYYPPLGGIGSFRALSYARHLPALGFRPVVVTPERGAYGLDRTLDPVPAEGVEVVRTGTREPAIVLRNWRDRRARNGGGGEPPPDDLVHGVRTGALGTLARKALRATYYPDHARGWIGPAVRAAVAAGRQASVRAVVSSSPPFSAHLVATRAARALRVPAIVEFRDLWTPQSGSTVGGVRAAAERRLERRILRDAAGVATVCERWRQWLLGRYGTGDAKPFRVLRNGYEETEFEGPPPEREPGVFRIVHTGTVYEERQDLRGFFRALAAVRAAGTFGELRPEVVFAGKVAPHLLDSARAAGCEDLVRTPGFLSHGDAIQLVRTATVNLLLTWENVPAVLQEGLCPGKMYEQMAARRPVLHLSYPATEAAQLLEASGGSLLASPQDEQEIARALTRLVEAERAGDATAAAPPWTDDLAEHGRTRIAAGLADLLRTVLD